jgi:hypothetical protein
MKDKKFSVVKTIVKKKEKVNIKAKKKCVRISDDIILEMIRFFKRRELWSLKLVNRRMKRVVELGDRKKQLRQRFVFHKILFWV